MFPASGAATPLSSPLPKVSSLLEIFFSNVYATKDPSDAPAPGKTPDKKPKKVPLNNDGTIFNIVLSLGIIFPIIILFSLFNFSRLVFSINTNTSNTANKPTMTTKKSIPS